MIPDRPAPTLICISAATFISSVRGAGRLHFPAQTQSSLYRPPWAMQLGPGLSPPSTIEPISNPKSMTSSRPRPSCVGYSALSLEGLLARLAIYNGDKGMGHLLADTTEEREDTYDSRPIDAGTHPEDQSMLVLETSLGRTQPCTGMPDARTIPGRVQKPSLPRTIHLCIDQIARSKALRHHDVHCRQCHRH